MFVISLLGVASNFRTMEQALHHAQDAIHAGDSEGASMALSQAARYVPWRSELWEQAGVLALKAGMAESSKSYLERVEIKGGLTAEGLQAMGDILESEGDLQEAVRYWEVAQKTGGNNSALHTKLAAAYQQLGELEDAIQHLHLSLEGDPGNAILNYNLGILLAALDPEAAPAYLTLAAELDPALSSQSQTIVSSIRSARRADDQAYLLTSSGQALASIEAWDLAAIALSKAVELNPEFADAWAYLGEANQHINQSGFKELNKALQVDPNSVAGNSLMALYWQRNERDELALVYFHSAANQDIQNPALQADIGNTLGSLGSISSAETHYQRAVDLAPRDPLYWRLLANFYIKFDLDLRERGASAARQAVILDPEDPASLDVMAQVYLLQDYPLIARRFLDRALKADSDYAPAHLHLGVFYLIEGNTYQAYQHLNLAKSLVAEDSQTAEQARRLLETNFP
jgi:tetratricopeptide (TPR) repeat protein